MNIQLNEFSQIEHICVTTTQFEKQNIHSQLNRRPLMPLGKILIDFWSKISIL